MNVKMLAAVCLLLVAVTCVGNRAAGAYQPVGEQELKFTQDGADLVVSMSLQVNNSDHVALTNSWVNPRTREVSLFYCVVQNRDLLVRSQKQIELTWRLAGHTKGAEAYRVNGSVVTPGSDELGEIGAKVRDLAEKGEQRREGVARP